LQNSFKLPWKVGKTESNFDFGFESYKFNFQVWPTFDFGAPTCQCNALYRVCHDKDFTILINWVMNI
jgi:hypothetical protein